MIEIQKLTLQRGLKTLLNQANATIRPNQRVGLIGKNGTGKSSLFALIKGELTQDSGHINLPKYWKIASVAQETPALDIPALDYVLQGDKEREQLQAALKQAEQENNGILIAEHLSKLEEIDAYAAPARASKLLNGLGFTETEHTQAVKNFSGGWRMRLNLAQALMYRADLLLLDEPTNHLDLETVLWLENYLSSLNCTQIIISHDRNFLNATTNHTLEISHQQLNSYSGNYDFYLKEKAQRLAQQQTAYSKQQQHIQHLQSFINRFKAKATKATQAQSRIKALAKLELIAPAHLDSEFHFKFTTPSHLPNPLLKLDHATLAYHNHIVLKEINLSLENGARYGLLGVNGSGKSTFIKALVQNTTHQHQTDYPTLISGEIIPSDKLNIGYFAQHQLDTLRNDQNPIWHIQQLSPESKEQDIRNFLGGFNFIGDMATQAISPFSGGEKARLALAMIVWQKPNLLLLDEPTNHLDLDMRHALTLALQSFQGAMILVSHDRSLLEATTDQFLLIHSGSLTEFNGNLDDYQRWRLAQEQDTSTPSQSSHSQNKKDHKRLEAQQRQEKTKRTKPIMQQIEKIEKELAILQKQQTECEQFLSQESSYQEENKIRLHKILAQSTEIKVKSAQLEEHWLTLQDELEQTLQEIEQNFSSIS